MTLDLNPQIEDKLNDFAKLEGVKPAELVEKTIRAYRPKLFDLIYTAENDDLVARLKASIAAAPTDAEAIGDGEEDLEELMPNMNANRAMTG
jgi:hypothetical protein